MKFFKKEIVVFPECERLLHFAKAIDTQIQESEIKAMNYSGVPVYEFQIEQNIQDAMKKSKVKQVRTINKSIHTTTPYSKQKTEPIRLASEDELKEYFEEIASISLARKKANCIGFCSIALKFANAMNLESSSPNITLSICSLLAHDHVFIKLTDSETKISLYFYPWYPRALEPNSIVEGLVFEEKMYLQSMSQILDTMMAHNCIYPVTYVQAFNETIMRLSFVPILNDAEFLT